MEPTDEELVARIRDGESSAFRMLVERHYQKVFGLAMSMVRNRDDALDLTQEAFLHVHRSIGGFRYSAKFSTWLYRIVTNLCIDHFRRAGRFPQTVELAPADENDSSSAQWPDPSAERPDDAVHRSEMRRALEQAFAQLSPPHRAVMALRELEGLSYEEIAAVLGCSIGTVMSRLHYARKRLQSLLRPYRPTN
ncbi:MAG TPA: sigma-70 family RNA polymerase sigma factor [Nitrospiria bacterium]|nr:sigma-70 family RNA polymerase sigma factor [Nitrospiria bacterium]